MDASADAEVPTLVATNDGDTPVLLVEGETVVGGQQDRTLNVSVLVPAGASVEIPVSCVQAGRWNGGRRFTKGKTYTSRRVRCGGAGCFTWVTGPADAGASFNSLSVTHL